MISIQTTENNDDRGRQFRIVICFCEHWSPRAFVCEDFLLAIKCNIRKLRLLRQRSSWFIIGLTMFGLRKHQLASKWKSIRLCFLCM